MIEGSGGGKANSAQAGGKSAARAEEILSQARGCLLKTLS